MLMQYAGQACSPQKVCTYEMRRRGQRYGHTMEFVYVLGMASKNHKPRPFIKPLPSALTYNEER